MNSASMVRERQSGRRGRAATWFWSLMGLALLIATAWLGTGPLALTGLADGVATDTVLLAGLMAGTGLGVVWLRRERIDLDDGLHDRSTGLFTRAYADETAARLVARDDRSGRPSVVLVLLSLSEADTVNRRYSHDAVAALLAQVATTLGSQCRASDVPFRYSADSLGVYLHCDGIEQAEAFGRRIRMLLASQQLEWRGDVLKPIVSMGVAAVESGEALPQLYQRAEDALAGTRQSR